MSSLLRGLLHRMPNLYPKVCRLKTILELCRILLKQKFHLLSFFWKKLSNTKKWFRFVLSDLENLVQSSEHGVIVVTIGSNINYLPVGIIIKMANAFSKRKELFLTRSSIHCFTVINQDHIADFKCRKWFLYQYTFTMYKPRLHILSQW